MEYAAVGLAILGAAAGLAFRWKVLLPIIILLPVAAIIFSFSRNFDYGNTVIAVVVAEAILQSGYFVGLLIRHIAAASARTVPGMFKGRRASEQDGGGQQQTASNAGVSKGS